MDYLTVIKEFGPMAAALLVLIGFVRHITGSFQTILDKNRDLIDRLYSEMNAVHNRHKDDLKDVIVANTKSMDSLHDVLMVLVNSRETDKREIMGAIERLSAKQQFEFK